MKSRVLLCPEKTINSAGFSEIKRSRRYDILRIIGKDRTVDLSAYSEIILFYQYPLNDTDSTFLDFVRKNRDSLKDATLLFDIPMEIIEDMGIEKSKERMKEICREVFGEDMTVSFHAPSKTHLAVYKFSEHMNMDTVINTKWEKESGHTALLTSYYLQEMELLSKRYGRFDILCGSLMIVLGVVLTILSVFDVAFSDSTPQCLLFILIGVSLIVGGYAESSRKQWVRSSSKK